MRLAPLTMFYAAASASVGIAVAAASPFSTKIWTPLLDRSSFAAPVGYCAATVLVVLALRELRSGSGAALVRLLPLAYGAWVLLGFATLHVLRVLQRDGWPIAGTQKLPTVAEADRALGVSAIGGIALCAGVICGRAWRRRRPPAVALSVGPGWRELGIWAAVLAGVGAFGAAIVTGTTRTIPLFSSNIDSLRYQQGNGAAFATLLEYEFLTAACLAGAAWPKVKDGRLFIGAVFLVSVVGIVAFRVERFPIFVLVGALLFLQGIRGQRPRRIVLAGLFTAVAGFAFFLGVYRLGTEGHAIDARGRIVRAVFDVAPEFREQAFAVNLYPHAAPFVGTSAVEAVASSLVPSSALRVIGADKATTYTDSSRQYSQTMRELGYYSTQKPIRVGLVGELWMDFGMLGVVGGLAVFGLVMGCMAAPRSATPLGEVGRAVGYALAVAALIAPLATLAPIALMVLGPLPLLRHLLTK